MDTGIMGRTGTQTTGLMNRTMLAYGITQDLQISVSGPAVFQTTSVAPARVTGMMPTSPNFEVLERRDFTALGLLSAPGRRRPEAEKGRTDL
ncbi:MAG: hypothetical protein NVS1B11_19940 [Terriglobales bacterium]